MHSMLAFECTFVQGLRFLTWYESFWEFVDIDRGRTRIKGGMRTKGWMWPRHIGDCQGRWRSSKTDIRVSQLWAHCSPPLGLASNKCRWHWCKHLILGFTNSTDWCSNIWLMFVPKLWDPKTPSTRKTTLTIKRCEEGRPVRLILVNLAHG